MIIGVPVIIIWVATEVFGLDGAVVSLLVFGYFGYLIFGRDKKEEPEPRWPHKSSYLGPQYPDNWTDLSREVKARDGYECGNCGSTHNLHAHHIVPLSRGGTNQFSNLRTLCENCHGTLHPHMRT